MASLPWFRWWVETCSDPKIRRLPVDQRWLWVAVLTAARTSPLPGRLLISEGIAMDVADLADLAALDKPQVEAGIRALLALELLGEDHEFECLAVARWDARQPASDSSTERVRKHRERKKQSRQKEQFWNVSGTPSESESESDLDTLKESSVLLGLVDVEGVTIDEVFDRIVELREAANAGKITSPGPWRAKTRENLAKELPLHRRILDAIETYDEPARTIAEVVEGSRNPQYLTRRNP